MKGQFGLEVKFDNVQKNNHRLEKEPFTDKKNKSPHRSSQKSYREKKNKRKRIDKGKENFCK